MSNADKLLKRVEYYEKMASAQKPEAGDLLNKATLFERLALYSDSKSFLQALAQAPAADPNRQLIWRALQLMQSAGVDEATTQPLGQAVTFNKVDISAIKRAIQDAILTGKLSPLAHGPEINELRNISSQLKAPLTPEQQEVQQGMAGPPDVTFQPDKITGLAPVDRAQQNALGKFVTVEGLVFVDPKKMNDGQLGPDTRKALNAFKQWYNSKATGKKITSDSEALQFVTSLVEMSPEKYGQ